MALVAHAATLRSRVPFLHVLDGFRTSHELAGRRGASTTTCSRPWFPTISWPPTGTGRCPPRAPRRTGHGTEPRRVLPVPRGGQPVPRRSAPAPSPRCCTSSRSSPAGATGSWSTTATPRPPRWWSMSGSGVWAARKAARRLNEDRPAVRGRSTSDCSDRSPSTELAGDPPRHRAVRRGARPLQGAGRRPGSRCCWTSPPRWPPLPGRAPAASAPPDRRWSLRAGVQGVHTGHGRLGVRRPGPTATTRGPGSPSGSTTTSPASPSPSTPTGSRSRPTCARPCSWGSAPTARSARRRTPARSSAEQEGGHAQGYFVYDSKKSGAVTISHLRFSPGPHRGAVADPWCRLRRGPPVLAARPPRRARAGRRRCHRRDQQPARPRRDLGPAPGEVQDQIRRLDLRVFVIDAAGVSRSVGLGGHRVHGDADLLRGAGRTRSTSAHGGGQPSRPPSRRDYGKLGDAVTASRTTRRSTPPSTTCEPMARARHRRRTVPARPRPQLVPSDAPEFVQRVTAQLMAGRGDLLAGQRLPARRHLPRGHHPLREARASRPTVPSWEPDLCIDCGKCAVICPHAAVRTKAYQPDELERRTVVLRSTRTPSSSTDYQLTVQVFPDDCTGCGLCVEVCPARGHASS